MAVIDTGARPDLAEGGGPERSTAAMSRDWPLPELAERVVLLEEDDFVIAAGASPRYGQDVVVSVRDLGEDTAASFFDVEIAKLSHLRTPAAANILESAIVGDRYFVLTVLRPHGVFLANRLEHGPLTPDEAVLVAVAALEVMGALHDLNLSGGGMRLRSSVRSRGLDGQERMTLTTFGLALDNGVDMFNELREVALRTMALLGGRWDGRLVLPAEVPEGLVAVFERALGLAGPALESPGELAQALLTAVGKRSRSAQRTGRTTRPQVAAMVKSDLLLASEYLATLPREPQGDVPELTPVPRGR